MKIGVVGNPRFKDIEGLIQRLVRHGSKNHITFASEPDLAHLWPTPVPELSDGDSDIDMLLTFGGDGTLLRGARLLGQHEIPILGINLGRVGFLTTATPELFEEALSAFQRGEYQIETRCTLESRIVSEDGEERVGPVALNDIVVHKEGVARVVRVMVWIDGAEVGVYSADGVIVSTPTGSTAYSLSAGGPIVMPDVDALVITAICPHTLAVRPLVVPGNAEITLQQAQPWRDEVLLSYDGQVESSLRPSDRVLVTQSPESVKLIRLETKGYFEGVRQKLQWGDLNDRNRE